MQSAIYSDAASVGKAFREQFSLSGTTKNPPERSPVECATAATSTRGFVMDFAE
jgi:hypothetical protein